MGTMHRDTIKSMRKSLAEWMAGCSPAEDVNPHIFEYFMSFLLDELERTDEKLEKLYQMVGNIDRYLDTELNDELKRLEKKIDRVDRVAENAASYHRVYG